MKIFSRYVITLGLMIVSVSAGEPYGKSPKTILASEPTEQAEASSSRLEPILTRLGQIDGQMTFRVNGRYFEGMALQEAEDFDGFAYHLELTVPLSERWQIALEAPIYFEAEGNSKNKTLGGVEIEDWGNALDFPSVRLDWQFADASKSDSHWNAALSLGTGYVFGGMWGSLDSSISDIYNHSGGSVFTRVSMDRQWNDCTTVAVNVGGRFYYRSDDINPSGGSDHFFLADASVAAVFHPDGFPVYPGLEVVYQGDFDRYNTVQVLPQVIIPVSPCFDLKAGAAFGLLDDGEDFGIRLQGVFRF